MSRSFEARVPGSDATNSSHEKDAPMKTLNTAIVLSALVLAGLVASPARAGTVEIDPDACAAVAYSPSTGKYGYAWNYWNRAAAERAGRARL